MRTNIVLIALCAAVACSPLSKAQLGAVQELALKSDTVSRSPEVLFREMSRIRLERGLFYAASLSSGDARCAELTAVAVAAADDGILVGKAKGYVDVFNSYLRALRSISSDQRWKGVGTQVRGIGLRVDSILYRHNSLGFGEEDLPVGYARLAGRVMGYVSEEVMQTVQGVAVRNTVIAGDTLVSASCDSLIAILRSGEMNELIEHERESVKDNYSAYLSAMELAGQPVPVEYDRHYVELLMKADNLPDIRNRCVSALRSLKKAHSALAEDFAAGEEDISGDLHEELVRLNRLAYQVASGLDDLIQ